GGSATSGAASRGRPRRSPSSDPLLGPLDPQRLEGIPLGFGILPPLGLALDFPFEHPGAAPFTVGPEKEQRDDGRDGEDVDAAHDCISSSAATSFSRSGIEDRADSRARLNSAFGISLAATLA